MSFYGICYSCVTFIIFRFLFFFFFLSSVLLKNKNKYECYQLYIKAEHCIPSGDLMGGLATHQGYNRIFFPLG